VNGILLDENLPERPFFVPSLPVTHATLIGKALTDAQSWNHAQLHGLVIVSKDADFSDRTMASSPPPWVVHLRFGNLRLRDFHALMQKMWPEVERLLSANKLICVYADRIEAFSE
jgi:predicted nuclease of predicted toxin-antitoxin system